MVVKSREWMPRTVSCIGRFAYHDIGSTVSKLHCLRETTVGPLQDVLMTIVNAPVSEGQVYYMMGTRQPQIGYVNHILFKLQLLRPRNDILQRLLMPLPLHKRQHRQRLSIRHRRDPDIPVKVEIGTHRRAE